MEAGALAIIAGGGSLPVEVAEAVAAGGRAVRMVGIVGAAGPEIERFDHIWMKFGEIGRLFRQLEAWGCRDLVLAGAVTRPHPSEIKLDFGALASLPDLARLLHGGDDGVLGGVVRFLETRGYRLVSVPEVAPGLTMAGAGIEIGRPDEDARAAIVHGMAVLAALAPHDVGQALVVVGGRAVAIEGLEGTDAMLERVAGLRASGRLRGPPRSGVLVKGPKRGQDLRVDLPTVGPRTLDKATEAGLVGLALARSEVLIVERDRVRASAGRGGLFVVGVDWGGVGR